MAKRIFRSIVLVAVLAVVLTAALIVPVMYNAHEEGMSRELRQEADALASALTLTDEHADYLQRLNTNSRVTLIAPDGTVLFDSVADQAQMENHAQRPEVQQALESGRGESVRASDTLSEVTIYYAVRADDGSVLRLGNTRSSMLGTFFHVLPVVGGILLCIALVSILIARRAAQKIVEPINLLNLDQPFENDAYDELAPLLTRMHRQHEQIDRQMRALENARSELAAIMANMREGMILLDKNETVLSINESAARIFAVAAEQAVGQNLLNVNRDADLHELMQRALCGEGGNLPMARNDRHYELYVSPVLREEKVRGAVLLILDVTERFAAEESRREFTANVSHELKTPLTSISGFAEIIRDGVAQPQDVQRFAGMICRESARLIALVNDILELSRLDERQNIGNQQEVELLPMLRELKDDFALAAEKKNLKLTLSGVDATVLGYPLLLREMFFNLIDNAIRYTPEGGKVDVTLQAQQDQVVCGVSDNGVGVAKEHQAHIFERFYRVDKSHSRATGGTGLGLAIVKHAAQIHHAQLKFDSEEGEGTTVTISFPV